MTDDQQRTESDLMEPELYQAADGSGGEESWQEDLPPTDDFQDSAEGEIGGEEADDNALAADDQTTAPSGVDDEAKKRGRKVMMMALGAVALFGAGIGALQYFGGEDNASAIAPVAGVLGRDALKEVPALPPKAVATQTSGLGQDGTTPTAAEADMTSIFNAGLDRTITPSSANIALPAGMPGAALAEKQAETGKVSEVMEVAPIAPAQPVKPLATVAPLADKAVMDKTADIAAPAVKAADPAAKMPEAIAPLAPVAPLGAPVATPVSGTIKAPVAATGGLADPALDQKLAGLSNEIAALRRMMEQTTQQASSLAAQMSSGSHPGLSAIEERLTKLEAKLATKPVQPVAAAAPVASAPSQIVPAAAPSEPATMADTTMGVPVSSPLPLAAQAPVYKKEAVKVQAKTTAKKPAAKEKAKQDPSTGKASGWVLRAATPDAAWLSKGAHTAELRQVRVGDSLPGLGRVKAIQQNGSSWIVVGTKGTVR